MEILVENHYDKGVLPKRFKALMDSVTKKRRVRNFQHKKLMNAIKKYYIFNPEAKVDLAFVVYYLSTRPKITTICDVSFPFSWLYDIRNVMQALYESDDANPISRMIYKKNYNSKYKGDFKWKLLIPEILMFILLGIPALLIMCLLYTMEPIWKLFLKIYKLFSQLF